MGAGTEWGEPKSVHCGRPWPGPAGALSLRESRPLVAMGRSHGAGLDRTWILLFLPASGARLGCETAALMIPLAGMGWDDCPVNQCQDCMDSPSVTVARILTLANQWPM
jgi:hypothetical protein